MWAAGWGPGILLGAQIAILLFFLNPDLPFAPGPVLRALLLYGGLLGALSFLLHLPWLRNRPRRARRILPWEVTAVLALAALLDWTHASIYAYYLPPGINVRLIKAASWISIAALIAFYTALLHTLHRRPYGRRSRVGFVLLVLFSLYIVIERREAFEPPPPLSPLAASAEPRARRQVLVVGLEGATFEALLPMAEQGRLPFVSRLLREGASSRLVSLTPYHREALWTTLTTGKLPYRHRVVSDSSYRTDFLFPDSRLRLVPVGVGFRVWGLLGSTAEPSRHESETLQWWEILPQMGLPCGIVGWPGGTPTGSMAQEVARPVFALGEAFFEAPAAASAAASATASATAPALPLELAARGRLFRVRPADIDPEILAGFGARPPSLLTRALARDLWRESLFRFLLDQHREVKASFLYLPGLGDVSKAYYGGYSKVQFEGAQHRDYLVAAERLTSYYERLDDTLAALWERQPESSLLVVVSAFGTAEPRGWRRVVTELAGGRPLAGYFESSPDGILLLLGPGIAAGARLPEADLVDVVPTVAYGLGLPLARDLDGQILTSAFDRSFLARHPLTFVPSYETLQAGQQ